MSTARFDLPAVVARGQLAALRVALLKALPATGDLVIDGSNVLETDGPGVQLLLALYRSACDRGVRVSLVNASAALQEAIAANRVSALLT